MSCSLGWPWAPNKWRMTPNSDLLMFWDRVPITQSGPKFVVLLRMTLNFWPPYSHCESNGIAGHHAHAICVDSSPGPLAYWTITLWSQSEAQYRYIALVGFQLVIRKHSRYNTVQRILSQHHCKNCFNLTNSWEVPWVLELQACVTYAQHNLMSLLNIEDILQFYTSECAFSTSL